MLSSRLPTTASARTTTTSEPITALQAAASSFSDTQPLLVQHVTLSDLQEPVIIRLEKQLPNETVMNGVKNVAVIGAALTFITIVIDLYAVFDGFDITESKLNVILAIANHLAMLAGMLLMCGGLCCIGNAEGVFSDLDTDTRREIASAFRQNNEKLADNTSISTLISRLNIFQSMNRKRRLPREHYEEIDGDDIEAATALVPGGRASPK